MSRVVNSKTRQMDMLHGSLLDKIILFAIPIAATSIMQQLFTSVDLAVVGRFDCKQAQAAVGSNGPLINLLLNLFVGMSVGANVVIANYIGQKKEEKIQDTVHTSMVVAFLSGIFLMILGILIAPPALVAMNTPPNVLKRAIEYLQIYFLGMPFLMIYNFGAAILRSVGDTRRPFICLLISGVVNAGLNLVLVIVFHMGVAGVAIATVISQVINAVMVWSFLVKEEGFIKVDYRKLRINGSELIKMVKIGVPAGLQGMVFSVANLFIQRALNSYGDDAVAGSADALTYEFFTYFVVNAFNQSAVTFTSQNYGAGKYDRCKKVFRLCMIMSLVSSAAVAWSFVWEKEFFIGLFTSDPKVVHYAIIRMECILTLNFLVCTYEISGSCLRGMGYSLTPALLTMFGTCVFRLVWIFTVCKKYRAIKVLLVVYPITWVITGTAVLTAYFLIRKRCFRQ